VTKQTLFFSIFLGFLSLLAFPKIALADWSYRSAHPDTDFQPKREDGSSFSIVDTCSEKIAYRFQYTGPTGELPNTIESYFYGSGNVRIQVDLYESVDVNEPEAGPLKARFVSDEIFFNALYPATSVFYRFTFTSSTPLTQNTYYWLIFKDVNGDFCNETPPAKYYGVVETQHRVSPPFFLQCLPYTEEIIKRWYVDRWLDCSEGNKPYFIFTTKSSNAPPSLATLNQLKSDFITAIEEGRRTTEDQIAFKASINDPDNDPVKLQIELRKISEPFSGLDDGILDSPLASSGSELVITRLALENGQYHWRARAVDDKGNVSEWQEFGTAGNMDFEVKVVPLYTQVRSPYPSDILTAQWANLEYAQGFSETYGCGSTISQCGCAITSVVMVARYYDIVQSQGKDVNPEAINTWLKTEPNGYLHGSVNWVAAAKYTNWRIKYQKTDNSRNNYALLDEYLNQNQPVIAKEQSGRGGIPRQHFLVIDGKLSSTYTVKDPAWYNTKTLNQTTDKDNHIRGYENGFDGLRIYQKGDGIAQSAITIALGSPAELLLTDSLGRKLGKDANGIEYQEIPQGWYFEDGFDDPTEEQPPAQERPKIIQILEPDQSSYQLQVIGQAGGNYTLQSSFYDQQGEANAWENHSETAQGYTAQYNLSFDPSNSASSTIRLFDEKPPEVQVYFEPLNQKLVVTGKDETTVHPAVSGVENKKEKIYQIKDEAGNTTKLIFEKLEHKGKEIKAELESVQYNASDIINFPKTELKYEWSLDKKTNRIKELEQRIKVKNNFDIKAKYNHRRDETNIAIKLPGHEEQKQTLPGTVIIKLTTKSGTLGFEY